MNITIKMLVLTVIAIIIGFLIGKKCNNANNTKKLNINLKNINSRGTKIIIGISCCLVVFVLIIIFIVNGGFKEKIDVKGTSMLEYLTILEKYGQDIDLDGITTGANCFTGKQTKIVNSKKYGKVNVEFSYCKSSDSIYIHIYN